MNATIVILVFVFIIGLLLGKFLESGRTQKIQSTMIYQQRASEKNYQDQVKTLEKDLKKLKGDLGMD